MNPERIQELLEQVRSGEVTTGEALKELKNLPYEDLGFARLDHHRTLRKGWPEAIYCEGKAPEHVLGIARSIAAAKRNTLFTRIGPELAAQVADIAAGVSKNHTTARCVTFEFEPLPKRARYIAVVTAGTSDIPVAEEAAVTAEFMGNRVERLYDVGVAGIHRLFDRIGLLQDAGAVVVAAGMEGALASVVGGMTRAPVVAVPTSIGYGASFKGIAALLGMLNTCSPGVAVVNIDNGFGAGYFAAVVNSSGDCVE